MQATFEGMILKAGFPAVKGPFTVEILEQMKRGGVPIFKAHLLPTRQKFPDIAEATMETAQDKIAALFTKQTEEWK
jgi:hypothetical protein